MALHRNDEVCQNGGEEAVWPRETRAVPCCGVQGAVQCKVGFMCVCMYVCVRSYECLLYLNRTQALFLQIDTASGCVRAYQEFPSWEAVHGVFRGELGVSLCTG